MDVFTPTKRSDVMRKIRSKDTQPELKIRRELHRNGFRFRVHARSLPGCPDIVLPKHRAVIQVRGCFWHGHTCNDGHVPSSKTGYWKEKLIRNKRRDKRNDRLLRSAGWRVLTCWGCKLESHARFEKEVSRILRFLNAEKAVA